MNSLNSTGPQASLLQETYKQELNNSKEDFKALVKANDVKTLSKLGSEGLQSLRDCYQGKRNVFTKIITYLKDNPFTSTPDTSRSTVQNKLDQAIGLAKTNEVLTKKFESIMTQAKTESSGLHPRVGKERLQELKTLSCETNSPDRNTNGKLKDNFKEGSYLIMKDGNPLEKSILVSSFIAQSVGESIGFMDDMASLMNSFECDHSELMEPKKNQQVQNLIDKIRTSYITTNSVNSLNLAFDERTKLGELFKELEAGLRDHLDNKENKEQNSSGMARGMRDLLSEVDKTVIRVINGISLDDAKLRVLNDVSQIKDKGYTEGNRPSPSDKNVGEIDKPRELFDPKTFVEFKEGGIVDQESNDELKEEIITFGENDTPVGDEFDEDNDIFFGSNGTTPGEIPVKPKFSGELKNFNLADDLLMEDIVNQISNSKQEEENLEFIKNNIETFKKEDEEFFKRQLEEDEKYAKKLSEEINQ